MPFAVTEILLPISKFTATADEVLDRMRSQTEAKAKRVHMAVSAVETVEYVYCRMNAQGRFVSATVENPVNPATHVRVRMEVELLRPDPRLN